MNVVSIEGFEGLLSKNMGLIIGPSLSTRDTAQSEDKPWNLERLINFCETSRSAGNDLNEARAMAEKEVKKMLPSKSISHLAKFPWAACISCTLDRNFLSECRRLEASSPTRMNAKEVLPRERYVRSMGTFPVFAMLGNLHSPDCPVTKQKYKVIKNSWRHMVRDFASSVRNNLVIAVGFDGSTEVLEDILSEFREPRATPTHVIVVRDEIPSSSLDDFNEILTDVTEFSCFDGKVNDLVTKINSAFKEGFAPMLDFESKGEFKIIKKHSALFSCPNAHLESTIAPEEKQKLRDLTFSPTVIDWNPFFHRYDFQRDLTNKLGDSIKTSAKKSHLIPTYILEGDVACGKTTVAKRTAFNLAKEGELVLWMKDVYFPDFSSRLNDFFTDLLKHTKQENVDRVILFIDSPSTLGLMNVNTVISRVSNINLRIKIVVVTRKLEWMAAQEKLGLSLLQVERTLELKDELSKQELTSLVSYLTKIEVFPSEESAKSAIEGFNTRDSKYILGLLYFFIPETKEAIKKSIKSEHLQLGESFIVRELVSAGCEQSSELIRKAYEFTAVCDRFNTPIPTEVLCGSIGAKFGEWARALSSDDGLWGLIYSEPTDDGETFAFRTRNSVVSECVIESINGGVTGRTGEIRILRDILMACEDGGALCTLFVRKLIARNDQFDSLPYQTSYELINIALDSLGIDKTLLHRKGILIRKDGPDASEALPVLKEALEATPKYNLDQEELDEHIRNSIAATYLEMWREGSMKRQEAIPLILKELSLSRSENFFNPTSVHIEARLIRDILKEDGPDQLVDRFSLIDQVMKDIDEVLLVLHGGSLNLKSGNKDTEMLGNIQTEIFSEFLKFKDSEIVAEEIFEEYDSQSGFSVVARRKYFEAKKHNKGSLYKEAYEYAVGSISKVTDRGLEPDTPLYAVCSEIFYDWQFSRVSRSGRSPEVIDTNWSFLAQICAKILDNPVHQHNILQRFILGFSLAQAGEWAKANPQFNALRRISIPFRLKRIPRGAYLNSDGLMQRYDGTYSKTEIGKYVNIEEIGETLTLHTPRGSKFNNGDHIEVYIIFSFEGVFASIENTLVV